MRLKKMTHLLLMICTFLCLSVAVLLMINACVGVFSQIIMRAFLIAEIGLGVVFLLVLILSKILCKIKFSSFNSDVPLPAWKCYLILFQIILFFVCGILQGFGFSVGQAFYLTTLSHFYWVADIGYIFPLMRKSAAHTCESTPHCIIS